MTINNTNATEYLLDTHKFKYPLPSVISQDPPEKIFGKRDNALVTTFILMSVTSWLQEKFSVCTKYMMSLKKQVIQQFHYVPDLSKSFVKTILIS